MRELSIPPDKGGVYFAQLLGMCDQVSFVLGKYCPFSSPGRASLGLETRMSK